MNPALNPASAAQPGRRIALGTVQFGMPYGIANQTGQVSEPEAARILAIARESGVDTIDTAIGYYESEAVLGRLGAVAFKVVTKLPRMSADIDDVGGWVQTEVDAALARLRVSRLYGLLLHHAMDLAGPRGAALYAALCALKDRGQADKIGVSIYAPEELAALNSRYKFDLVQGPLNLVDRRLATTGWLRRLKDQGIEIHTRSVFLQGLLLMPRAAVPAKFAPWTALWDRWGSWSAGNGDAALRACLAYPLSLPEVDRVLVGADSAAQFEEVLSNVEDAPATVPDLSCEDERLINPANWTKL